MQLTLPTAQVLRDAFLALDEDGDGLVSAAVVDQLMEKCGCQPLLPSATATGLIESLPSSLSGGGKRTLPPRHVDTWSPVSSTGAPAAAAVRRQLGVCKLSLATTLTAELDFCAVVQRWMMQRGGGRQGRDVSRTSHGGRRSTSRDENASESVDAMRSAALKRFLRVCDELASDGGGEALALSDEEMLLLSTVFTKLDRADKGFLDAHDVALGVAEVCVKETNHYHMRTETTSSSDCAASSCFLHAHPELFALAVRMLHTALGPSRVSTTSPPITTVPMGFPSSFSTKPQRTLLAGDATVSLSAFVRSFQRRSGAFPPQLVAELSKGVHGGTAKENGAQPAHPTDASTDALAGRYPHAHLDRQQDAVDPVSGLWLSPFELSYLVEVLVDYTEDVTGVSWRSGSRRLGARRSSSASSTATEESASRRPRFRFPSANHTATCTGTGTSLTTKDSSVPTQAAVPSATPGIVPLSELEKALRADVGLLFEHLEAPLWEMVQRVCLLAQTCSGECAPHSAIREMDEAPVAAPRVPPLFASPSILVSLEDLVVCLCDHPSRLGLAVPAAAVRLSSCLHYLTSVPRVMIGRLVELIVELGLHRPSSISVDADIHALALLFQLRRLIPRYVGFVGEQGGLQALAGLARMVTAAAVVRSTSSSLDGSLSLSPLLQCVVNTYYAVPPPLLRVPAAVANVLERKTHSVLCSTSQPTTPVQRARCRRLSSAECTEVQQQYRGLLQQTELLTRALHSFGLQNAAGVSFTVPGTVSAEVAAQLEAHSSTCSTRPSIAQVVALRSFAALERAVQAVQHGRIGGAPRAVTASDVVSVAREAAAEAVEEWARSALGDLAKEDAVPPEEATGWAAYAVRRTFPLLGMSTRRVGLAISQLEPTPLPHVAGGVWVAQEALCASLATVLHSTRPDLPEAELHHAVWDVAGCCPAVMATTATSTTSTPTRWATGRTGGEPRAAVFVNVSALLWCLLDAFPLLPSSHVAFVDLCFPIDDVESVYFSLKRLIAVEYQARMETVVPCSPLSTLAISEDDLLSVNSSLHGVGGDTAVPFERLAALLDNDALLYLVHSLGTQHDLSGDVVFLSQVLKALSLSAEGARVTVRKLRRARRDATVATAPLWHYAATHTGKASTCSGDHKKHTEQAHTASDIGSDDSDVDTDEVGALLRAKAIALALPAKAQHALARLFVTADTAGCGYLTRSALRSFFTRTESRGSGDAADWFLDALFGCDSDATDAGKPKEGVVTLEDVLRVYLQERSKLLSRWCKASHSSREGTASVFGDSLVSSTEFLARLVDAFSTLSASPDTACTGLY